MVHFVDAQANHTHESTCTCITCGFYSSHRYRCCWTTSSTDGSGDPVSLWSLCAFRFVETSHVTRVDPFPTSMQVDPLQHEDDEILSQHAVSLVPSPFILFPVRQRDRHERDTEHAMTNTQTDKNRLSCEWVYMFTCSFRSSLLMMMTTHNADTRMKRISRMWESFASFCQQGKMKRSG